MNAMAIRKNLTSLYFRGADINTRLRNIMYFYITIEISLMKFLSLQPFVPSGKDFEGINQFFQELGFTIRWDADDYVAFENNGCRFILQKFDNKEFAENFMLTVGVENADEFRKMVIDKQLPQKFGI